MTERVRPSAVDQFTTAAPLGSGQPKRKHLVLVSKRKQLAPSDKVTTKLLPHHVPRSHLGLVVVKLVFGRLFEAFQHPSQTAKTETSAGADTQPAKRVRVSPIRRMLASRYVMILICTFFL
jgi:hypothetical protein